MRGETEAEGGQKFYPQPDLEKLLEQGDVRLPLPARQQRERSTMRHCTSLWCVTGSIATQ